MAGPSPINAAADRLWAAQATGTPCPSLADLIDPQDLTSAYAVQEVNTRRWLGSEERVLSGRKIALTDKALRTRVGASEPAYGMLYADMERMDGEAIAPGAVMAPRVEAEIAYVIAAPLTGGHLTMVDLIASIGYVVPAIEVAGSRYGAADRTLADTVADNAASGLYVLGQSPRRPGDFDQRMCGMVMFRNGEPVSYGAGVACYGSPLNAVLWLARKLARAGQPLGPGDLVLSGALGTPVEARSGDVFEAHVNGLGSVRAAFARA